MKKHLRLGMKLLGAAVAVVLMVGIAVPYISADRFGRRLQLSLERSLGRKVELGKVHFSLFSGPGFSVDEVKIHEDPAFGIEPIIYIPRESGSMEVVPSLWPLIGGRFVIASISLRGASINLTKSGPASEWGRWNFSSVMSPSLMRAVPAIHIRDGRINFKFGDDKSVFYLTATDLDIAPPRGTPLGPGNGWRLYCSAQPARTDRPAQGLGSFVLKGKWYVAPERVDLDLALDRTGLGELTALLRGQAGSVHGFLSSSLHLGGPINNIGIAGRLTIQDVHRWDLLPPQQGYGWPLDVRGRLDLISQQVELQSSSPANTVLPLAVRFRATDYLTQPRWAVALNWNQFPAGPLLDLARHMGAQLPANVAVGGTMDGAISYSGEAGFGGQLAFRDAAVTIPNSSQVRFPAAQVLFDQKHIHVAPARALTAGGDEAQVEADYSMDEGALDLAISTQGMKVASLREQAALAAVPWLEQVESGEWSGQLRYHKGAAKSGWSGQLELTGAKISVPGLADLVELASAKAQIDASRIVLRQIEAQAGKVAFSGDYRFEPEAARPRHLSLRAGEVDAADLEAELMPTLRRPRNLIARALGRATIPDWLKSRDIDGTIQIDDLSVGGARFTDVRARFLWDVTRLELDVLQAKLERAALTGKLAVNLRGTAPAYRLTAKVKGLSWQSGRLDADGVLETSGAGAQLLANLTSEGVFSGAALDFGTPAPCRTVAGSYALAWAASGPRLRLTGLNLRTEDETFTGRGATQEDGRLVVLLSNGAREMRVTGPLAKLKVEETIKP